MSAIYIYPIQHQLINDNGSVDFMKTKSDEKTCAINSIIEVNTVEKSHDTQSQRFWLSTSPPASSPIDEDMSAVTVTSPTSDFVESCTVTHSFANRKRSVVKRRKSVLSSSFTAEDEEKTVDTDANPVVLETTEVEEETKESGFKEDDKLHREEGIHLKNDDFNRGQGEPFESSQVPPQDSAIDLSITEKDAPISPSSSSSSSSSSSYTTPQPPIIQPAKKKSSWSPRKIFSSSNDGKKKLSKKSSISSFKEKTQEKFTISSLFSRKKTKPSFSYVSPSKESSTETLIPRFNHTRLPIHTERAIYRLSHIKLANTKRPLRDQVVISNLMFWYLSIVNQPLDDIIKPPKRIARKKRGYQSPYSRTSSSSDEEDEDDLTDEEEEQEQEQQPTHKRKYTLFCKKKETWLPSFSMPKQHEAIRDSEDDIPLAMYQRNKN